MDFSTALATVVGKIPDAIQTLSGQLSVGAKELWVVLVRQAIADGVTDIIWGIFIFIMGTFLYRAAKKMSESDRAFAYIFAFVIFIAGLAFLTGGIKELINPQYYALQDIFTTIQNIAGSQ